MKPQKRYNLRNIAQRSAKRLPKNQIKSADKKLTINSVNKIKKPKQDDFYSSNGIYPDKLSQMHHDLDKWAYNYNNLSKKEKEEYQEKYGSISLNGLEKQADQLLLNYVQFQINSIGQKAYYDQLQRLTTRNGRVLLALRCFIAATTDEKPKETLIIYSNREMNATDFFPKNSIKTMIDPKTGEPTILIDYQDDPNKNPYERSEIIKNNHQEIAKFFGPEPTKRDKLPKNFAEQMQFLLEEYGYKVSTHEEAWNLLDGLSKQSSINDRIVSRISYLIINATTQKKTYKIDNKDTI